MVYVANRVYIVDNKLRLVKQIFRRGPTQALMSVVNLGEVLYITEKHHGLEEAQRTAGLVEQLPIEVIDIGRACGASGSR